MYQKPITQLLQHIPPTLVTNGTMATYFDQLLLYSSHFQLILFLNIVGVRPSVNQLRVAVCNRLPVSDQVVAVCNRLPLSDQVI